MPPLRAALLLALVGPTFGMALLPAALPLISLHLGGGLHGDMLAQRTQSMPSLGLAVGGLVAGRIITLIGLRHCLLGASILYAIAAVVGGLSQGAAVLLASCLVIGLAGSLLSVGLVTATGELFDGPPRARILGFQTAMSDFAAIGGVIGGALLAQRYGWRGPFAIYVVFGGFMALLIAISRTPKISKQSGDAVIGNRLLAVGARATSTYVGAALLFVVMASQTTLLPFHLAAHGLSTPNMRAVVLAAQPASAVIAALIYGLIGGRISDSRVAVVAILVSALGYAGFAQWSGGIAHAVLSAAAIGAGIGLTFPLFMRSALRRTPPSLHGYSMGLLNTAVFGGGFLSPLLLGPLFQRSGAGLAFGLCAAGWIVVGGIALRRMGSTSEHWGGTTDTGTSVV